MTEHEPTTAVTCNILSHTTQNSKRLSSFGYNWTECSDDSPLSLSALPDSPGFILKLIPSAGSSKIPLPVPSQCCPCTYLMISEEQRPFLYIAVPKRNCSWPASARCLGSLVQPSLNNMQLGKNTSPKKIMGAGKKEEEEEGEGEGKEKKMRKKEKGGAGNWVR